MDWVYFLIAGFSLSCSPGPGRDSVRYWATTPCDSASQKLLGLPAGPCEMLQWSLRIEGGSTAGRYSLKLLYGMSQQGTHGFTSTVQEKNWSGLWSKDGGNRRLILQPESGGPVLSFRQVNPNLLHLLDRNGGLLPGNGGWPYTLNRVSPQRQTARLLGKLLETVPGKSQRRLVAVFEGRTPCPYMTLFFERRDSARCQLVKWKMSFYQDSLTHRPDSVKIQGIRVGPDERPAALWGTWSVRKGWGPSAEALVYQVRLNGLAPGKVLSMFLPDPNVLYFMDEDHVLLVGGDYASYSLSRVR